MKDGREARRAEAEPPAHEYTRTVVHRLSRAIGHLESVKKMAEEGRACTDVLLQISAVRGALNSISRIIFKDYMEHCVADAMEKGDYAALEELNRALEQLIQ